MLPDYGMELAARPNHFMEISMILKSILAVALAAALAAPAAAQQTAAQKTAPGKDRQAKIQDKGFAELDRNKDGYISRDEAKDAPWTSRFSEIDRDNDERISQSEFEAVQSSASGKTK
jgi:Ca2+-binding EF-hand superfamily protein